MSKLDREQEVITLAAGLNVDWRRNAVESIIALCHQKISKWLRDTPRIQTVASLEQRVCEQVKLVFEEIQSDDDLEKIIRKYIQSGEPIFKSLKNDLDSETFATLIERRKVTAASRDRYVAVIDCRGDKKARRFFTRWHEIAHLLTLQGQLELPLHRSTTNKTPTERLMDVIAGEVGFYAPLFDPILHQEVACESGGTLTFAAVERVRQRFSTDASFEATLNACVQRLSAPVLLVEIGLGYKKEEAARMLSKQLSLLNQPSPVPKLRALKAISSRFTGESPLRIHRNMQVPSASFLYKIFFDESFSRTGSSSGTENLSIWRHSDGTAMSFIDVQIEAKRISGRLIALITRLGS